MCVCVCVCVCACMCGDICVCMTAFAHGELVQTMHEALELREQLWRTVAAQRAAGGGAGVVELLPLPHVLPAMPPGTNEQLRQLIAAGFLDSVARRVPPTEAAGIPRPSKAARVPYRASAEDLDGDTYIHPKSSVYNSKDDSKVRPPAPGRRRKYWVTRFLRSFRRWLFSLMSRARTRMWRTCVA